MPYLPDNDKFMMQQGTQPRTAGELTYCLTLQIQRFLATQHPVNYAALATVLGALEGCRLDFERRVVVPYEDQAIQRNGDVWP